MTDEFYETPSWVVRAILPEIRALDLLVSPDSPGRWIEPCYGRGAIVAAVNEWYAEKGFTTPSWHTIDIKSHPGTHEPPSQIGDFCKLSRSLRTHNILITNPPFSIALDIVGEAVESCIAPVCAFLLPLHFLASSKRCSWLRDHTPSIHVFPKRPSFIGGGRSIPRAEYAWMIWSDTMPRVNILALPSEKKRGKK